MRIGAPGNPRENIAHVGISRANRGAAVQPVLDVGMRAVPGRPEKSCRPAPCQKPVASQTYGDPRGLLNHDAALRTEGDGAVVEEIVGRNVGGAGVESDRLRQSGSSLVRSVQGGAVVDGQHRVPGQLARKAELQTLRTDAVVEAFRVVRITDRK